MSSDEQAAEIAAPVDQREYVLWRALQQAPYPARRFREASGALYDTKFGWAEVDWVRDYIAWYDTIRLKVMRAEPLSSLGVQMLNKQLENDRLRALLRQARASIDHGDLIQDIDREIANWDEDIEL